MQLNELCKQDKLRKLKIRNNEKVVNLCTVPNILISNNSLISSVVLKFLVPC